MLSFQPLREFFQLRRPAFASSFQAARSSDFVCSC
jgi:hypothetical protein